MSFDNEDKDKEQYQQYSNECEFFFDSAMIPQPQVYLQQFEEESTCKKRKSNDQFCLQRFSLVESKEERKSRVDKKREDRKIKLEQCKASKGESEKSTNDQTSSQQEVNKDEIRKIRNRNSAQLSRDRKKNYMSNVVEHNSKYQEELDHKNLEINQYLNQIDILNYKIQALEDLSSGKSIKCPHCFNMVYEEKQIYNNEQTYSRVQHVYSNKHLKTYGLLSLFVIVTMLGCLGTVQQEGYPVSLMQMRKPQIQDLQSVEAYFNNGDINQVSVENLEYEPFQSGQFMKVTTMDQLRNIKTFSVSEQQESTYNIQINFTGIPTEQTLEQQIPTQKTLFLNCTVAEEYCDTLIRVMNSKHLNDIHRLQSENNSQYQQPKEYYQPKEYFHGQQITILQVYENGNQFVLNTVKCVVDGISSLQFDSKFIERITI